MAMALSIPNSSDDEAVTERHSAAVIPICLYGVFTFLCRLPAPGKEKWASLEPDPTVSSIGGAPGEADWGWELDGDRYLETMWLMAAMMTK